MDIREVIERAGGAKQLGLAIRRSRSTVLEWTRVPAEHVAAVEKATGIPRHELRPDLADIFKPAPESASAPAEAAA